MTHADRFVFGTDAVPPDEDTYRIHARFLETADEHFRYDTGEIPSEGRWTIGGLDLPDDVLRKVYRATALRLIPGLGTDGRT